MTEATLAWAVRSVMVVTAAIAAYLLVQTEIELEPIARVICGAIGVGLAALNPSTVASKLPTRD